jgi:signal transduction histidine kinase
LRTPLFPIKSQVELLLSGNFGELNDQQKESLAMIKRNEERLHSLVAEVLEVSQIESRKLKIVPGRAEIKKIIEEVAADLRPEAERRGIKLSLNIPADLPEISADPQRIAQVAANLANNAVKFSNNGGAIAISAEKKDDNLLVKVEDQGIGLSPENIKKLFTPFFQVESGLVRERKGTGLGLAICKGIVEAHGGKIWAESEGEGRGSAFSFTLPINGGAEAPDASFTIG